MKRRKFILGLLAAGLSPIAVLTSKADAAGQDKGNSLLDALRRGNFGRSAQHRSHSSHSSHRSGGGGGHRSHSSHSSHRSSSGGGGAARPAPSRRSNSTPPSSILPEHASDERLSPKKFSETAKRVQRALSALGYYNGAIDGIIGRESRAAITRYQIDYKLQVTATITPELLDSLGIK